MPVSKDTTPKPLVWPGPLRENVLCGSDSGHNLWLAAPTSLLLAVAPWGPAHGAVTCELPQAGPSTGTSDTGVQIRRQEEGPGSEVWSSCRDRGDSPGKKGKPGSGSESGSGGSREDHLSLGAQSLSVSSGLQVGAAQRAGARGEALWLGSPQEAVGSMSPTYVMVLPP